MDRVMSAVDVRNELTQALALDLIGPGDGQGTPNEVLSQAPSRWYLTGFLVPLDAEDSQKVDEDGTEQVDAIPEAAGVDDDTTPEPPSARQRYLPSSIGLSVLVSEKTRQLKVTARWGDYRKWSVVSEEGRAGDVIRCLASGCRAMATPSSRRIGRGGIARSLATAS